VELKAESGRQKAFLGEKEKASSIMLKAFNINFQ
jgi:hypothetical protein